MALEIPLMFSLTNRNMLQLRFSKMGSEIQVASQSWQALSFLTIGFYISSCQYKKEAVSGLLRSLPPGRSNTAVLPGILTMVSVPSFSASV